MPYVPGSGRIKDVYHATNVYANNVLVATWEPPGGEAAFAASQGVTIDGIVIDNQENQFVVDKVDADNIDFDDTTSTSSQVTRSLQNISSGISNGILTTNTVPANSSTTVVIQQDNSAPASGTGTVVSGAFGSYTDSEYPKTHPIYSSLQLTASTSLATFTKNAKLWNSGDPKWLKAQKGLTVPQILNNLANLASNCYEPIVAKYPNIVITNTFRQGNDQAQHGTGQAMDIQFSKIAPSDYFEIAKWIRDNVAFDQLLLEKAGNSIWIHVSFWSGTGIRVSAKPINRVATMIIYSASSVSFKQGLQQVA